jgi:Ca2+:H+ antiporter
VKELVGVNILLVFAPIGFFARTWHWNAVLVSAFNFLAIIPLSALVSDASDTLAARWGPLIGGLVNATFGNTVELIVRQPPQAATKGGLVLPGWRCCSSANANAFEPGWYSRHQPRPNLARPVNYVGQHPV